ncbi:MAG: hypothetical protein WC624_05635 [Candidatus Margulisiibacteriota bacterium]
MANEYLLKNIIDEIKKGITSTWDNNCIISTAILIYAGIEAMANLDRPKKQERVQGKDFINWANKHLQIDSLHKITGE